MESRAKEYTAPPNGDHLTPGSSGSLWTAAAALVFNWKRIAAFTVVVAVVSVGVALVVPRHYAAEARVLKNEEGGLGSLLGLATRSTGGITRLLSGSNSDYTRYLAILHSRSLRERMVDEFDLIAVYRLENHAHPLDATLKRLEKNLDFQVSSSFDHLSIVAFDRDSERAVRMADFLVEELNRRHVLLTSESARQTRLFVEERLNEARADLDSVRVAMQRFQERHGVIELTSQAEAFLQATAEQRGRATQLEVQYRTLLAQYGADNPQVQAARQALGAAQAQERRAIGGGEALMPVPLRELPGLGREYAALMQEQLIQAEILQTIYPLYEQARFQERNEAQAVQVLDQASASARPVRPSRSLIVLVATLTAGLLACLFVLGNAWLKEHHVSIAARLQSAPGRARVHV